MVALDHISLWSGRNAIYLMNSIWLFFKVTTMKLIYALMVVCYLMLSGCSSIHTSRSAISNGIFYGDPKLSLGGNLELLAGNDEVESKNNDDLLNSTDVHFIKESAKYTTSGSSDIYRASSLALTAKYIGNLAAVSEFLSNPADYPVSGNVVLIKLNDSDNPKSPEMLQLAFKEMTNEKSALIKNIRCENEDDVLSCKNNDSNVGTMRFSTIVDFEFVKKINPKAPPGKYAAFGFEEAVWTTTHLKESDYKAGNANVVIFSANKFWYTVDSNGSDFSTMFTYRVTERNAENLKTAVYIHGDEFKDKKIAELR